MQNKKGHILRKYLVYVVVLQEIVFSVVQMHVLAGDLQTWLGIVISASVKAGELGR